MVHLKNHIIHKRREKKTKMAPVFKSFQLCKLTVRKNDGGCYQDLPSSYYDDSDFISNQIRSFCYKRNKKKKTESIYRIE